MRAVPLLRSLRRSSVLREVVPQSALLLRRLRSSGTSQIVCTLIQAGPPRRDAVPIAFELERVAQLTRELIPEIQTSQKVAAQLEVEVEYLEREIKTMSDPQEEAKSQMQKLRAALGQSSESPSTERHSFGDRTFSRAEIEQDLSRRLERYENAAVQLQAREKLLATRRQTFSA